MREPTITSTLLRRINAAVVLNAMRAHGPVTASDLMAATGLTRPTVHAVCAELIELGWIRELQTERLSHSQPGRRARRYEFDARAGHVLGIDAGAHKVVASVADLRGDGVAEVSDVFAAPDTPPRQRFEQTRAAACSALARAGVPADGLLQTVVGIPAPIGGDGQARALEGDVARTTQVELTSLLLAGLPGPVLAENDANLAVLAERWRGAASGVDDAVALLTGERLGAGVCLGGRLIRGIDGGAGEMAFLDFVEGVGSADGIGSVTRRLGAEAVARGEDDRNSDARSLFDRAGGDPSAVSAEMVLDAARDGDETAIAVLDRVTGRFGRALSVLATLLNPELIVIGGAPSQAADVLLDPLEQRMRELTNTPARLAASVLGDHAVVVGAVRMALEQVESRLFREPAMVETIVAPAPHAAAAAAARRD